MIRPALILAALLTTAPALANGLTPVELARVQQAESTARAKVLESMGKKDIAELKGSERAAYIRKEQAELTRVHKDLKVDSKAYARQLATLPVDQRKELELAAKALEKEAKDQAAAAAKGQAAPATPQIIELDEDGMPVQTAQPPQPAQDRMIEIAE